MCFPILLIDSVYKIGENCYRAALPEEYKYAKKSSKKCVDDEIKTSSNEFDESDDSDKFEKSNGSGKSNKSDESDRCKLRFK